MKEVKGHNLTLALGSLSVSYNDLGEGNTPLIFLHGYPFDKSSWNGQLDALQLVTRVIAYDIRGFGGSIDEDTAMSIDLFADDLIRFMDALHIERAIVCGLSMGGYIALNAQKRFPERFTGLILCDTQCNADSPEGKANRYRAIEGIKSKGVTEFGEAFVKKVFAPASLESKKDVVEKVRQVVLANSAPIMMAGLVALAERTESCSTLVNISVPTLFLCGADDAITPTAQSQFMHDKVTGSVLRIIENAGHVSNLEQPETFNFYIRDFLESVLV